jgi:hypothetical protein
VRKALNDNPVAQIAVLGVLAVIVAFLLMSRGSHGGGSGSTATSATPAAPAPADTTGAAGVAPTTAPPAGGATGAPAGGFVAGPGLPAPVVKAYADDKAVVLLVFRHRGLDDSAVRSSVERLRGRSDVAVFVTHAANIARYARITEGVDVNRVPALIVLRPRRLTHGTPTASVSYGFRGPDSVDQAVRNALYKGPNDLPYYPR